MKKNIIFYICCAVFGIICGILLKILVFNKYNSENISLKNVGNNGWINNGDIHILPSIDDEVEDNSMWCGTFQLVWNDMVNEVVKQDVVFTPQLKIVENLNKQTFKKRELSPTSYYAKFGLLTLDLKDEIEKGIKNKFNETSNVLNQLDWSNVPQSDSYYYNGKKRARYGFYAMLKKIFKFENVFDELDSGRFNNKHDNIKYFGIKGTSDSKLYKQVYIYYYNSDNDFAVFLKTKEGENVILARGVSGNSFMDIYNNILKNRVEYKGNHYFTKNDYLKVPELSIKTLAEFTELEDKEFTTVGGIGKIEKALQTIELKLDEKGGEIKSEAWIMAEIEDSELPMVEEHRYFYFDKPYIIMLKESDKDLPYFAAQISDITLFQN